MGRTRNTRTARYSMVSKIQALLFMSYATFWAPILSPSTRRDRYADRQTDDHTRIILPTTWTEDEHVWSRMKLVSTHKDLFDVEWRQKIMVCLYERRVCLYGACRSFDVGSRTLERLGKLYRTKLQMSMDSTACARTHRATAVGIPAPTSLTTRVVLRDT